MKSSSHIATIRRRLLQGSLLSPALVCFVGTTWASVYPISTPFETQAFNSASSAALAGWTEFNSRVSPENYGFSASDNTLGADGAGEAGGNFQITNARSYYADLTLDGKLDLNRRIEANGEFAITNSHTGNLSLFLGHFNATNSISPADQIGIQLFDNSNSGTSLRFRAVLFYANGGSDVGSVVTVSTNGPITFQYIYQPNFSGNGTLTAQFFTPTTTNTSIASVTARTSLAFQANAFGFENNAFAATDTPASIFMDNLTYTIVPEPATLGLLAVGVACLALLRRR